LVKNNDSEQLQILADDLTNLIMRFSQLKTSHFYLPNKVVTMMIIRG